MLCDQAVWTLTVKTLLFKEKSRMFWYSWKLSFGITWTLLSCSSCALSVGSSVIRSVFGILSFIWVSIMAESWTRQINILSSKSAQECCSRTLLNSLTIKKSLRYHLNLPKDYIPITSWFSTTDKCSKTSWPCPGMKTFTTWLFTWAPWNWTAKDTGL